jgi:hypothetical protein
VQKYKCVAFYQSTSDEGAPKTPLKLLSVSIEVGASADADPRSGFALFTSLLPPSREPGPFGALVLEAMEIQPELRRKS